MRAGALGFVAVLPLLVGCSATAARTIPRDALRLRRSDPPPTAEGRAVVAFVTAQVGHRYCWGGEGPACFDCSGLVQRAWSTVGVRLPRTSTAMGSALSDVPLDRVRAGDVLWWPGHVAIYAGDGLEIEALDSRHGVVRRPVANPYRVLRPGGS